MARVVLRGRLGVRHALEGESTDRWNSAISPKMSTNYPSAKHWTTLSLLSKITTGRARQRTLSTSRQLWYRLHAIPRML